MKVVDNYFFWIAATALVPLCVFYAVSVAVQALNPAAPRFQTVKTSAIAAAISIHVPIVACFIVQKNHLKKLQREAAKEAKQ